MCRLIDIQASTDRQTDGWMDRDTYIDKKDTQRGRKTGR
jgi:hypothetical protein